MKIKWLGNSCIEIFGRLHIVIDPNFKVSPEEGVNYTLVTHEHPDHFNIDCYNQINSKLIAPRTVLDEHKLKGKEARVGIEVEGIKVLESFCLGSEESYSYLISGILHSGDSAKFPDVGGVKVIFTACFPDYYGDYISEFKRLNPGLVIPIHFNEGKKQDATGLGERVKKLGIKFRLLELGEILDV